LTTNTEQLLHEAASEALLTLDGIADTNPRDRADFENKDEWITWAKSRAKWAADKLRAPISRELLAERVLKQMLEQDAAPNRLHVHDGELVMIDGSDVVEYLRSKLHVNNHDVVILPRDTAEKMARDAALWREYQLTTDTRYALCG